MPNETILTTDDTLKMLDNLLEKRGSEWWNNFYSDRERDIPFFVNKPDENLVKLFDKVDFLDGLALDIGCGNGRNSIFMGSKELKTIGIDISGESIKWAEDFSKDLPYDLNFLQESFFDFRSDNFSFDLIHDSGCLHHIKPHRRGEYLQKVSKLLKGDGYFSLTCFNQKGGADLSDHDVYRERSMKGGLGFSEEKLRLVLSPYFDIISMREMSEESSESPYFGKDFCWVVLMRKRLM